MQYRKFENGYQTPDKKIKGSSKEKFADILSVFLELPKNYLGGHYG